MKKTHRRIGYHASHEQIPPGQLLEYVIAAESAGFQAAMCSDHLFPWSQTQGHSGFAWSWLGAALQATSLSFGVVNAPGYRYNPVIIAQAAATLSEMFPERFWIAVGSGEAMNEHITGEAWPTKDLRNARLRECVDVMRALWAGERVTHRGLITVLEAQVYSLPQQPPLVVGAAITEKTARWMGEWADALITAGQPRETLKRVIGAFRENGGESKPIILQQKISYAADEALALREAHEQWRTNIFSSGPLSDMRLPEQFEAVGEFVTPDQIAEKVRISSNLEQHADWIMQDFELGFTDIYLHNVNLQQTAFIEAFGEHVLPKVKRELESQEQ